MGFCNYCKCTYFVFTLISLVQEEIKITGITVFVNPYSEPDEEEEEKAKDEKNVDDEENVSFWFL
jgi:hypothetical protein